MILEKFIKKTKEEGWIPQYGISKRNASMHRFALAQMYAKNGSNISTADKNLKHNSLKCRDRKFLKVYYGDEIREMYFFYQKDRDYIYELRLHEEQKRKPGKPEYQAHKQWIYLISRKRIITPEEITSVLEDLKTAVDIFPTSKSEDIIIPKKEKTNQVTRKDLKNFMSSEITSLEALFNKKYPVLDENATNEEQTVDLTLIECITHPKNICKVQKEKLGIGHYIETFGRIKKALKRRGEKCEELDNAIDELNELNQKIKVQYNTNPEKWISTDSKDWIEQSNSKATHHPLYRDYFHEMQREDNTSNKNIKFSNRIGMMAFGRAITEQQVLKFIHRDISFISMGDIDKFRYFLSKDLNEEQIEPSRRLLRKSIFKRLERRIRNGEITVEDLGIYTTQYVCDLQVRRRKEKFRCSKSGLNTRRVTINKIRDKRITKGPRLAVDKNKTVLGYLEER